MVEGAIIVWRSLSQKQYSRTVINLTLREYSRTCFMHNPKGIIKKKYNSPLKVNKCVYVLDQLEDKVDVDNAISSCICLENIWIQCIQLFDHFLIVMEIWNINVLILFWFLKYWWSNYLRLHLSWFSCYITYSILSLHCPTVSYFNFETLDFFCKLNSLGISKRFPLFIYITNI